MTKPNKNLNYLKKITAYIELLNATSYVGGPAKLAVLLGYPVKCADVQIWLSTKRIPAQYAQLLQHKLNGYVKQFKLRPDIFPIEFDQFLQDNPDFRPQLIFSSNFII